MSTGSGNKGMARGGMRRRACILGLGLAVAIGHGCASTGQPGAADKADGAEAARARLRSYYVRVQPEATGLVAVDDDGETTYLEFNILPPGELRFFDSAGKPLRAVWVRNMAALPGTHKGILLRLGTATSYVSVNPLADQIRKPAMAETAQVYELRERLLQEGPRKEMEQIAARIAAAEGGASPRPGAESPSDGTRAVPFSVSGVGGISGVGAVSGLSGTVGAGGATGSGIGVGGGAPAAGSASSGPGASAATAGAGGFDRPPEKFADKGTERPGNGDAADAGWPRTQRVFFATNSVGISAPDDGLHKIVSDARLSDEIWISGHTDNKGPRTVNAALAKRRAEAIRHILTSRGIAPERIIIVNAPIDTYLAANETEVGRAQNRRADVTFVRARSATAPRAGLAN